MTLALLPELVLSAWALALTLYAGVRHRAAEDQRRAGWLARSSASTLVVVLWSWSLDVRSVGLPFMMALDVFRWATSAVFLLGAILTVLIAVVCGSRAAVGAGVLRIAPARHGRHDVHGRRLDLIVLFLGLELAVGRGVRARAGINRRSPFAEAALKYFLLGAFASGFLPAWHRLDLRNDGSHQPDPYRLPDPVSGLGFQRDDVDRRRHVAHRFRVQDRRGAVSHVGAGCLRRRAHAGDGVYGGGRQGRRVRRVDPSVVPRAGRRASRVAGRRLVARGAYHGGRQPRRDRTAIAQAHAGLQLHRACRLPARRGVRR